MLAAEPDTTAPWPDLEGEMKPPAAAIGKPLMHNRKSAATTSPLVPFVSTSYSSLSPLSR